MENEKPHSWKAYRYLQNKVMSKNILWTNLKKTKGFFWKNSTPNIKHETLCNDYKAGGFSCIKVDPTILFFVWFLFSFSTNYVTIFWTQYIFN